MIDRDKILAYSYADTIIKMVDYDLWKEIHSGDSEDDLLGDIQSELFELIEEVRKND